MASLFKLFNKGDKKQAADWAKQKDDARKKRTPVTMTGNVLNDIKENIMLGEDDPSRKDDGKMPGVDEINIKFEKLMKYRGISANDRRRKVLMQKSLEEKWKLIQIHQKTMFEQENSFKITGAPEYYVHVLKEAPTRESITELCKMLKTKPEEWVKKFLDLDGLSIIFAVLVTTSEAQAEKNRQYKEITAPEVKVEKKPDPVDELIVKDSDDEDSDSDEAGTAETPSSPTTTEMDTVTETSQAKMSKVQAPSDPLDLLQAECIKAFRTLMNTPVGMQAFIKSKDKSCEMIARLLDSENLKTKTQIFFLLSTICVNSEEGFWLSLDAVNAYKLMKREKVRFQSIIQSLKTREYNDDIIMLIISTLMFFNALLTSSIDASSKKQLKLEFTELGLLSICDTLKNDDIDDTIMIQIATLEDEMLEVDDDEAEDSINDHLDALDNPTEILKLIRLQLSGTNAFTHFVSILHLFLVISSKSNEKEKTNNMSTLANIIKQAINVDSDGKVEEISVKELQLQDRVSNQQKKNHTSRR